MFLLLHNASKNWNWSKFVLIPNKWWDAQSFFLGDSNKRIRRPLSFLKLTRDLIQRSRNVPSLVVRAQILNHQAVHRQQIDVGITVDVLIHFHCIFHSDRTKRRINFCTKFKFLRRRTTFQGRPIQHSVTRRLCPNSGNDPNTRFAYFGVRHTWLLCLVMVAMVVKLQGVRPPAVGKNVTVRNESLNQTTVDFSFCLHSNSDSSFDSISNWFSPISWNAQDFSRLPCEQYGGSYWEAWKRIEMATSHVTPLSSACLLRDHQGQQ